MLMQALGSIRYAPARLTADSGPPLEVDIREIEPREIPEVVQLIKRIFPESPYNNDSYEELLNLPESRCFLGIDEGRAVGLAGVIGGEHDEWGRWCGDFDTFQLNNVGVIPEFRGRKVAEQLVHHVMLRTLIEWKSKSCTLMVVWGNEGAKRLYEKFGFRETWRSVPESWRDKLVVMREMICENLQDVRYAALLSHIQFNLKKAFQRA